MIKLFKHSTLFLLLLTASPEIRAQEVVDAFGNCSYLHGFVNTKDSSKSIPPVYCSASGFSEGLAAVKKGEKWGYIDVNNKTIIDFRFDYARSFKQGRAIVQKGDFYGVINKEGEFVIPPDYYDLISFELENRQYYISRDSTFFQGTIDSTGKEILPHQYTFIITYESNLSTQRFYKNIPFYTAFQTIDTTQGTFYEQFNENAFRFSPEKGRHDIYDLKFNKLASKLSTNYSDGFQNYHLQQIDAFLNENRHKSLEAKRKAVDSLLALPVPDPIPPTTNPAYLSYGKMTSDEVISYLDSLGYRLFTEGGKTGLKKGNEILIPAKHTKLKLVNGVILFPQQEDVPVLKAHYGGRYRHKKEGLFDIFAAIPYDGEPNKAGYQYSLSGAIKLPVREVTEQRKKVISKITSLGFLYLHTGKGASLSAGRDGGKEIRTYTLVNWKGEELLPPVYRKIEVLQSGHVLVTRERELENGTEEHYGLFNSKGEEIIPVGVYSSIKRFDKSADNLYLVTGSDKKVHFILKIEGNKYTITNKFTANSVSTWALDEETGMLPYQQVAADAKTQ